MKKPAKGNGTSVLFKVLPLKTVIIYLHLNYCVMVFSFLTEKIFLSLSNLHMLTLFSIFLTQKRTIKHKSLLDPQKHLQQK